LFLSMRVCLCACACARARACCFLQRGRVVRNPKLRVACFTQVQRLAVADTNPDTHARTIVAVTFRCPIPVCPPLQHHTAQLDLALTPLELLQKTFPTAKIDELRAHLGRYGLVADLAVQTIGACHPGIVTPVTAHCDRDLLLCHTVCNRHSEWRAKESCVVRTHLVASPPSDGVG
jgi:hypothetical protein